MKRWVIAGIMLTLAAGIGAGRLAMLERQAAVTAWDEACPSESFDFVFGYGTYAPQNVLDTSKGMFTRGIEPIVTVPLTLAHDELEHIRERVGAIHFFDYPDVYRVEWSKTRTNKSITPNPYWRLQVICGETEKELRWNDDLIEPIPREAVQLRELFRLIREAIESKEAYKTLPPQTFFFM